MTWICVAGAMHELGQKGEVIDYVETAGVFNLANAWPSGGRGIASRVPSPWGEGEGLVSVLRSSSPPRLLPTGEALRPPAYPEETV